MKNIGRYSYSGRLEAGRNDIQKAWSHTAVLYQGFKIDAGIADTDACAIEHVISSDSIYAMQQFLANFKEEAWATATNA